MATATASNRVLVATLTARNRNLTAAFMLSKKKWSPLSKMLSVSPVPFLN